jgi:hypothetical protein
MLLKSESSVLVHGDETYVPVGGVFDLPTNLGRIMLRFPGWQLADPPKPHRKPGRPRKNRA